MDKQALINWMRIKEKTVVDVASECRVSTGTVYRFLDGKTIHRALLEAIKGAMEKDPIKTDSGPTEAA